MKGWVNPNDLLDYKCQCANCKDNIIHVHQTSPDAVEVEGFIEHDVYGDDVSTGYGSLVDCPIPPQFIGKRVKVIISEMEE